MDTTTLTFPERLGPALAKVTSEPDWNILSATLISGGKSNLTFLLHSAAGELILRRPPTGHLLPSAHDMLREARVQSALADTRVPVPRIILVDEGELLGVPCYVMTKVDGHVIRGMMPAGYAETAAERESMSRVYIETLTQLHSLEPATIGLQNFGRPTGFVERQVRRWSSQWEMTRSHDLKDLDELCRRLSQRSPKSTSTGIVHGDYKIDNLAFGVRAPGEIVGVLDWELSTLGDHLTDLGMVALYWRSPGDAPLPLVPSVTQLDGFWSRDQIIEEYATLTDTDLTDLNYYQAFAHFKFAVIAQGVDQRFEKGEMGGQTRPQLRDGIARLAADGLTFIKV